MELFRKGDKQKNADELILTFDAGTSAMKAALFSPELELVSLATVAYEAHAAGDRVEMEPNDYLLAMRKGVAMLGDTQRIAAIGLTTQGETLIPVDREGRTLGPAIVWLDARASVEAEQLKGTLDDATFFQTTGMPEINGALPLAKAKWLKENEPDRFGKTAKLLLLGDYLRFRLTGNYATHASLATSTGWLDIRTGDYWEDALKAADIPLAMLPEILPSGEKVGILTTEAGEMLGLRAGIPVFTGAMDQTATVLALCTQEGRTCETLGTAHVVATVTQQPVFDLARRVTVYRHALDEQYICLPIGSTGGMALTWFLREFGGDGEDYAALDRLAEQSVPGCRGVTFLPHLCGCVNPESIPNASAGFYGARLASTRADFARAVLESVGYELRLFLDLVGEQNCAADQVVAIGGGAKSAFWTQMRADLTGRDIIVPAVTEAASAGAGLLAGWGAGMIPRGTYPAALQKTSAVFKTDVSKLPAYEAGYRRYQALGEALKYIYDKEGCL